MVCHDGSLVSSEDARSRLGLFCGADKEFCVGGNDEGG